MKVHLSPLLPAEKPSVVNFDMPAAPREGDSIEVDHVTGETYSVVHVYWTPTAPDYDLVARVR